MQTISLKYESVGSSPDDTVVFAIMDREFIAAVGHVNMRDLFENRAAIISSGTGTDFAIVVETGGETDNHITAALDLAIEAGYRVDIDDKSVRSPGADHDVRPAFSSVRDMVNEVRKALEANKELESRNDEISPS